MIKIAESEASIPFRENNIAVMEIFAESPSGDTAKTICLGKHNGRLFAFAYKCPHAGALLSDGWIDMQGNIVCPMHQYKFRLQGGSHPADGGYILRRWKVEQREDGIYLDALFI